MRVSLRLPLMLSFLSGTLTSKIRREGETMLLEDRREV